MTPRDRTLLLTLVLTGLRIGEASSLRARDVELEKAAIHVRENSPIVAGRLVPGTPKTAKSRRSFIISKAHADLLRDHMAEFGERLPDGTLDPEGFVFTTAKGTQIRHDNWRVRIFKEACRQAKVVRLGPNNKIETPTIKDLRDTAASLAAEAGYSLAEVGKLLGHTNVTMTGKYTHLYPEHTKDLSEALASMVLSPQGADTVGGQVVDLASRRRSVSEEGATLI
jgi:integrase